MVEQQAELATRPSVAAEIIAIKGFNENFKGFNSFSVKIINHNLTSMFLT
jgi:hypothetical protein